MAHAGKEFALGSIGMVGGITGFFERPAFPGLFSFAFRNVLCRIEGGFGMPVHGLGQHHSGTDPLVLFRCPFATFPFLAVFNGYEMVFWVQGTDQVLRVHDRQVFF